MNEVASGTSLWHGLYALGSVLMGVAQVLEAIRLLKQGGVVVVTPNMAAFSMLEAVWAVVSYAAWRQADAPWPWWLPVSFVAYVLAYAVAGVVLALQQGDWANSATPQQSMHVPTSMLVGSVVFGAGFALLSAHHGLV